MRVLVRTVVLAMGLPVLAGCGGGRTLLLPLETLSGPCAATESVHPCGNTCGAGQQICRDGVWQPCVVPTARRDCSNACGEGEQICRDGAWGACSVPVTVSRECSSTCGKGEEICRDGIWGTCLVPVATQTCTSSCGTGKRTCRDGVWSECDAPLPGRARLLAIIRDFRATHPDMESPGMGDRSEPGLVQPLLGDDDTPVYARPGGTGTVTSPATFAQWFHDVPGVNVTIAYEIPLQASPSRKGMYEFSSLGFFPIDGLGFGNEDELHNFDFTLATRFTFQYKGGEMFRFTGDDDLWVFINRRLAIDLGGLHQMKTGEVVLDERAGELGITPGHSYQLHLFFAERHKKDSNFVVETSIADPGACD